MGLRPDSTARVWLRVAGRHELKRGHVVEVGGRGSVHGGVGDLDDEHLGEELDRCSQQMTGVAGGAVFLEADRDVDVRCYSLARPPASS